MANNLTQAEANRLLDASLGAAAFAAPTGPMKLALVTANGSASAAGTEVTGGSYARQTVVFGAASGGSASNTALITFAGMPATTVVGLEVFDSSGSPRRCWWGALSASKTVQAGDSVQFAIGSVIVALT
ncbi:phage tail fiber protein [Micromonospora sp. NBC_00421]|uniref:phage tail fiber protein n=1 Tax=Micromonospora sp. NBC_00421 TaxID=2975976 RepID=UPI002E2166E7